jgi:hypothetical protein
VLLLVECVAGGAVPWTGAAAGKHPGARTPRIAPTPPTPTHREVLVALPVAGHHVVALRAQALGQVAGDEASGARHAHLELLGGPEGLKGVLGQRGDLLVVAMEVLVPRTLHICHSGEGVSLWWCGGVCGSRGARAVGGRWEVSIGAGGEQGGGLEAQGGCNMTVTT